MSRPDASDPREAPPEDARTMAMLEYERRVREKVHSRSRYVQV